MSKFVGESEKFIRALFAEVRANMPAILMLDECDRLLSNPNADSAQSHHYRLLQNELKNQWSDLVYSRDEVIVVGATNKPHDIDMDGFGLQLSLKLHVELPNNHASPSIIKAAIDKFSHNIDDDGFQALGHLCHDPGLSGYDVDYLVEAQLRKAIRKITLAKAFKEMEYLDDTLVVPCAPTHPDAQIGPWTELTQDYKKISYVPFSFDEIKVAIHQARPTVDSYMVQKHVEFASQYATKLAEQLGDSFLVNRYEFAAAPTYTRPQSIAFVKDVMMHTTRFPAAAAASKTLTINGRDISVPTGLFINGEFVTAQGGNTMGVEDPSTGKELIRIQEGREEEVDIAVKVARKTFEAGDWSHGDPV
ncbi:Vacuolar protein sorting-associated protein 4 [Exophiala xenobiotica]|nr:Vacuolar protein sorting-associated protein 4 [Exophiala xenobiotica]